MTETTYILLGPPGSGKSTEAKILGEALDLQHVEMGSELRKVALQESPLGKMVNEIIYQKKELVPDGVVGLVLDEALRHVTKGVLLDGAPRRASQIDEIEEILVKHNRKLCRLIYLSLSEEDCVDRISRRFLCKGCGKAYKQGQDPETESGICSFCQGTVAQRFDDTPEGVRKRYQVFHDETMPVIQYYREKGLLVEVNAMGEPQKIAEDIMAAIKE